MQRLWGLLHAPEGSSLPQTPMPLIPDEISGMGVEQSYYLMHYGDTLNNASMPDIMRKHAHSRTIGYFLAGRSIGSIGMMCSRL